MSRYAPSSIDSTLLHFWSTGQLSADDATQQFLAEPTRVGRLGRGTRRYLRFLRGVVHFPISTFTWERPGKTVSWTREPCQQGRTRPTSLPDASQRLCPLTFAEHTVHGSFTLVVRLERENEVLFGHHRPHESQTFQEHCVEHTFGGGKRLYRSSLVRRFTLPLQRRDGSRSIQSFH